MHIKPPSRSLLRAQGKESGEKKKKDASMFRLADSSDSTDYEAPQKTPQKAAKASASRRAGDPPQTPQAAGTGGATPEGSRATPSPANPDPSEPNAKGRKKDDLLVKANCTQKEFANAGRHSSFFGEQGLIMRRNLARPGSHKL